MLALAHRPSDGTPYLTQGPNEHAAFTIATPPLVTGTKGLPVDYVKACKGIDLKQPVGKIKRECRVRLQPFWNEYRAARRTDDAGCQDIVERFKDALEEIAHAWGSHREKGLVIECVEQADAKQLLKADLLEAVVIGDIDLVCDLFEEGGSRVAAYSRKHRPGGFDLLAMTEDDALRMRESFGAFCVILAGCRTSTAEHVQRIFKNVCPVVICC